MKKYIRLPVLALISASIIVGLGRCGHADPALTVDLRPMIPTDSLSVRWSPKGEKLPLTGSGTEWTTEMFLGPGKLGSVKLLLSTSAASQYPDQLKGDWNRSGSLDDDSVIRTVPKETRAKIWSSFKAMVNIPVVDPLTGKQVVNPYPLDFWYVYDPIEPETEKVMRYSRRGWMQGAFSIDSLNGLILLTEMKMDGIYDTLDSWALASPADPRELYGPGSRSCTDHAWLGNQAFRITGIDPSGRRVKLVRFDPGMTREEEAAARDQMAVDRQVAHSGKSVAFLHDYKLANKERVSRNQALLIDFETTWCGPCKQMDQWVYSADPVVEKSVNLVAVKVDGDENRDLVKQYKVTAYPTIILVGTDGVEIRRVVGYQSVSQMIAFLTL